MSPGSVWQTRKSKRAPLMTFAACSTKSRRTNLRRETKKAEEVPADAKANPDKKPAEVAGTDQSKSRPWEFARLEYLAGQAQELLKKINDKGETRDLGIEGLALTPDGTRYFAGRKDGSLVVGSAGD